jgi:hypothetical protein
MHRKRVFPLAVAHGQPSKGRRIGSLAKRARWAIMQMPHQNADDSQVLTAAPPADKVWCGSLPHSPSASRSGGAAPCDDDMASGGYLKLYRDLLGSDMWQLSDSHLRVMFGLMMLVNWRAANWRCHRCKTTIEVLPGETCMSRSSLAGRIGCSPRVLDRAIGHMIEAGFVAKVGGNKCGSDKSRACHTHIRLINWEKYQSEEKRIVAGGNDPVPRRLLRRYPGGHSGGTQGVQL